MKRTIAEWQRVIDELRAAGEIIAWEYEIIRLKYIDKSANSDIIETRGWVTIHGRHVYLKDNAAGVSVNHKMSAVGQRPPDFDKYPVKEDPAAVERVKKQMSEELGIAEKDINLTGIKNAEVLQPFADRLKVIRDDTGMSFPPIVATEIIVGDPCCIADFRAGENRLYISSKFFNSKEATIDTLTTWADRGIIPSQARTIQFLAEHEAAHIQIPASLVQTDAAKHLWKRRRSTNYNDTDIYEFFADSAAIYRVGKNVDSNTKKAVEYLKSGGVVL